MLFEVCNFLNCFLFLIDMFIDGSQGVFEFVVLLNYFLFFVVYGRWVCEVVPDFGFELLLGCFLVAGCCMQYFSNVCLELIRPELMVDLEFCEERFECSGFPSEGSGFFKLNLLWGVNLGLESCVFVFKYLKVFENCFLVRLLLSGV